MSAILFYDNVSTGHHPGYITGIMGAAEGEGLRPLVASVEKPDSLLDEQRWIPVTPYPLRALRQNRRQLQMARERAQRRGVDDVIDLYYDKNAWVSGALKSVARRVHVLHHAEQYGPTRRGAAKLRTLYLRRALARLTQSNASLVVHTSRAAELIGDLVPPNRLVVAGYPVVPLPADHRPLAPGDPPRLLFVGAGRREKGLDLLFEGLSRMPGCWEVRIVGRQPEGVRMLMAEQWPDVKATWLDRFVDDFELYGEYSSADLAVLPYRSTFGDHGGPSSVLLETLSAGLPIVTTTALADQLPPAYGGSAIAHADSGDSLGDALIDAYDRLEQIGISAAVEGPRHIATHHTFAAYLSNLVAALNAAGDT